MKNFLLPAIFLFSLAIIGFASLEAEPILASSSYSTSTVTLTVESEIALTGCSDITMVPNISLSQDSSIGTTTCTVETTNVNGYAMTVQATSSPALVSGANSFADYSTSSPSAWSVGASEYLFGFSVYGTDVNTGTWGTGSNCGTAGADAYSPGSLLHYGFYTNATTTASRSSETGGSGISTTICVAAEQGNSVNAPSGTYQATIVVTASTQ